VADLGSDMLKSHAIVRERGGSKILKAEVRVLIVEMMRDIFNTRPRQSPHETRLITFITAAVAIVNGNEVYERGKLSS
jgi:hypothetical protein